MSSILLGCLKKYNLGNILVRNKATRKLIQVRKVDINEKVNTKVPAQLETTDLYYAENYVSQHTGGEIFLSKEHWSEGIALVCINHPEKRNSITGKMMVDLRKCLLELESWKNGKGVILYGKGSNFGTGGIRDFAKLAATPTNSICVTVYMLDILKRLRKLPLVSVGLVHGLTTGGGAELATYLDYLVMAENTKISFDNGNMELITTWGAATRLAQLVGEQKALEVLLSSKIYNSKDCLNIGLASKIVDTNNRMQEALKFLKQFTVYSSTVVQSYKKVVKSFDYKLFEELLRNENREFINMWNDELKKMK